MPLILASKSPRRAELLRQIGVNFRVLAAEIDETQQPDESPETYVLRMASSKAARVLSQFDELDQPVLAADTVVVCDAKVFGKPADREQGLHQLRQLSGRAHKVMSAICMATTVQQKTVIASTDVYFRPLRDEVIQRYWQFDEPHDKAGGYAIQGLAAVFVEKIVGSYSNVVGLPIETLIPLLEEFKVPYWSQP